MTRSSLLLAALLPLVALPQQGAQPAAQANAAPPTPADPQAGPWQHLLGSITPRNVGPTTMGGRVTDLAVYDKEPRIFYVAAASGGLWKTENAGLTFDPVFDRQGSASLGACAVSQKDPNLVWVGTGESTGRNSVAWGDGVYRSTDGGKTWQHMGLRDTHHISRIVIDPKDNNTVYVGALGRLWGYNGERGVYKTTDGGKTWTRVLNLDERTGIGDLDMDPKNPRVLYAVSYERLRKAWDFLNGGPGCALWKSTDAGKTWKKLSKGMPPGPFGRIGLDIYRSDTRVLVATVEYRSPQPAGSNIESSADANVEEVYTPGYDGETDIQEPSNQEPKPQDEAKPKEAEQKPAEKKQDDPKATPQKKEEPKVPRGGVYISKDGGESWTFANPLNPRPFYFSIPAIDPLDVNRIYIPGVTLHYSEDQGKTFRVMRTSVHVDHHAIWINPKDSNHILIGQDGGVAQSRDRGKTWQMLNHLPIGQYYAVTYDMRRPYWLYGGLQDNGTWATPTQTRRIGPAYYDSHLLTYGDGFYAQVDPTDWRVVYTESQGGAVVRSNQVTGEQKNIKPTIKGERLRFNWSTPIHLSPHNPHTLFVGANRLMRSTNRGDTWTPISGDLTTNDPSKLRVGKDAIAPDIDSGAERHCTIVTISESPMKPGLIWVGTDDGLVWVTQDGGANWSSVGTNIADLPRNLWCTRVAASRHVEGRAYATFDGHRSNDFHPYVYVTEDFGKTWTSLASGLPEYDTIHVIREGQMNPDLLFLGSEMSLRVSLDRGKSWSRIRNGFPTVAVHDLTIHPRELDLIVATHGRALWTVNVSALEQLNAEALKKDVAVFKPQDVLLLGRVDGGIFSGDALWTSRNTQPGTQIFYLLKTDANEDPKITVSDVAGATSQELTGAKKAGLNAVAWSGRLRNRMAQPGDYRVTLKVDGKEYITSVRVEDVSDKF